MWITYYRLTKNVKLIFAGSYTRTEIIKTNRKGQIIKIPYDLPTPTYNLRMYFVTFHLKFKSCFFFEKQRI